MPDPLLPELAVLQIMKDYVDKYIDVASRQKTLLLAIRALPNQQAKEILEYILSRDEKGIEKYFYHNHYFVMKFIAREGKWLDNREFVEKQIDDLEDSVLEYAKRREGELDIIECANDLHVACGEIEKALEALGVKGRIKIAS